MPEESTELAQPATQEAGKEAVNVYDSKHGDYQEQSPSCNPGPKPPPQDKPFNLGGGGE